MANPSVNQNDQSQATLETIWQLIAQLPNELRLRLRSRLDETLRAEGARTLDRQAPPIIPLEEFAANWERNCQWLEQNRHEYAGQWVALDGDRLITSGPSAREVYATLKAAGISGSMVLRVEHPDDLPVIE